MQRIWMAQLSLLGVARNDGNGIEVMVHPMLISSNHPLATVNDSFNAVFVHGDAVDDAMFMGRGAENSQLLVPLWAMLLTQLEILYTTVQQELVALATSLFQLRI